MTAPAIAARSACPQCGSVHIRPRFGARIGIYDCTQCGFSNAAAATTTPCARCTQPVPQGVQRCPACGFQPGDSPTPTVTRPATGPRHAALEHDATTLDAALVAARKSYVDAVRRLLGAAERFTTVAQQRAQAREGLEGRLALSTYSESVTSLRPLTHVLGERLTSLLDAPEQVAPQLAAVRTELAKLEEGK